MFSGWSVPTEDYKFSLLVCIFFVNIPVYRLDFKSAIDVMGHIHDARPGLKPNGGN